MKTRDDAEATKLKMLLLDQVADIFQVDERTVRRWCTNGDLEFVKFGRNVLRFKPEWIDEFIERKQGRVGRKRGGAYDRR